MNIFIVIGSPVKNMGSQALVRGLTQTVKSFYPNAVISVMASEPEFNAELRLPGVDHYLYRYSIQKGKINFERVVNKIYKILMKHPWQRMIMRGYRRAARNADAVFLIGGDNYDVSYRSVEYMRQVTGFIDEIGRDKMIMYNCSMAQEDLIPEVVSDLSTFRYLTARDQISFQNMRRAFPESDVRYYPDIAFCMEPEPVPLPEGWAAGNMVGINLSSLVGDGRYGASEEEILLAYRNMIHCILRHTPLNICLIPHVKQNDDLSVLRKLYDGIPDKSRAILIGHENYNSAQKKYIISNCRMFVGARTHATIAAYSSCVPALVVGYSIKAQGIAEDLFGTADGNVVPVALLKNPNILADTFLDFYSRETQLREVLRNKIPAYRQAAAQGVHDLLLNILYSG